MSSRGRSLRLRATGSLLWHQLRETSTRSIWWHPDTHPTDEQQLRLPPCTSPCSGTQVSRTQVPKPAWASPCSAAEPLGIPLGVCTEALGKKCINPRLDTLGQDPQETPLEPQLRSFSPSFATVSATSFPHVPRDDSTPSLVISRWRAPQHGPPASRVFWKGLSNAQSSHLGCRALGRGPSNAVLEVPQQQLSPALSLHSGSRAFSTRHRSCQVVHSLPLSQIRSPPLNSCTSPTPMRLDHSTSNVRHVSSSAPAPLLRSSRAQPTSGPRGASDPSSETASAPDLRLGARDLGQAGSDGAADPDSRERDSAPYVPQKWTYLLTEIPPDLTAARLSDESKEAMYALHQQDPTVWTAARLAREYRIREQRAHAILWLKELEKEQEKELGKPLDDTHQKAFEQAFGGSVAKAAKEQHVTIFPSEDVDATEDEDERMNKLLQESAREEKQLVEEFVRRMNFNKLQISGKVKTNALDRRRPKEGWSYVVEELGEAGRRGRDGGRRYVVGPDGTKRGLNELEKTFLDRERTRRRRRIVP